jgi:hypothetical protein
MSWRTRRIEPWLAWLAGAAILSACGSAERTADLSQGLTPAELSPWRWLRADRCTAEGASLACTDLAGPSRTIAVTPGQAPSWRADGIGGEPALVFGATPEVLVLGEKKPRTINAYTVLAVIAPQAPGSGGQGVVWGCEAKSDAALTIEDVGGALHLGYGTVQVPLTTSAPVVVGLRVDGKGHGLFVAGDLVDEAAGPLPVVDACVVGYDLRGSLAELIVYDRALNGGDIYNLSQHLAAAYGIGGTSGGVGEVISFEAPARPTPQEEGYPDRGDGTALIAAEGDMKLVLDPAQRNPLSTMTGCHWWLMRCYESHADMDDCYRSVPRCAGDTPWLSEEMCCPEACYDDYAQRRGAGVPALDAFFETSRDGTCFPGLAAFRAGGAP